ncbi:MAG: hypothetical protein D6730_23365 [Bacteroidetes bacterium]|nr:MAG: hypothetical protein D6730_23365 [Bacteroidota bacterium]
MAYNMKTFIIGCVALLMLGMHSSQAQSVQDTTQLWRFVTKDGNEYVGKIFHRTQHEVVLKTNQLGMITLQMADVKKAQPIEVEKLVDGEIWIENPQATRYFWAPNGYGLKRGEGYYQNVWVFFNQASVGLSDHFSIGAGVVPLFLFGGGPTPVWLTPKFSLPVVKDKFQVGGGALLGTVLGEGGVFGIAYGVTTIGSRDKNLNLGIGYGFTGDEWANAPTITLSGMLRTGRRGYVLTENYFIGTGGESLILLSVGGRTVWPGISLDYGAFIPLEAGLDTFIAIPWLGLVVPF